MSGFTKMVGLSAAAALSVTLGISAEAHAGELDACGGVHLEAQAAATCEVVRTETCGERCVVEAGETVCAARLTASCEGSCVASASGECQGTCDRSCVTSCTATPDQPPNCMGFCMSDCQQACTDECADEDNQGQCRSSCAHTCSSQCHAQCDAAPPPECDTTCKTACSGSCQARANLDCQISCQSDQFGSCETQVVEECRNECTTTGAAIFCSGQFLATGGNLQACADQLRATFDVSLDVQAQGTASGQCDGDRCSGTAEGETHVTINACAMETSGRSGAKGAAAAVLGFAAFLLRRTRRRAI
jgi:hypothetical protein